MNTLAEIQGFVQSLSDEDFKAFSSWFEQYEEERSARPIGQGQKPGPLKFMMDKASAFFR